VPAAQSPFRFGVSDLLHHPGRRRLERLEAPVSWGVELSSVDPGVPLTGELALDGVGASVYVTGRFGGTVVHTCHRCTTQWSEDITIEIGELIGKDDDTDYRLDGEVADTEPVLRDALMLALPLSPICRPDCLGLCASCGADLNTGACPGHDEDPESPFAALRDILEP
jgi:uncharacterized protein